jgi:hypothetical protein
MSRLALEALRDNMTGPPSLIFTVPSVWPLIVAIGNRIGACVVFANFHVVLGSMVSFSGPKMREETLASVSNVLGIVSDLYALSLEQRATLARYVDSLSAAKTERALRKKEKLEKATAAMASATAARASSQSPSSNGKGKKQQQQRDNARKRTKNGAPAILKAPTNGATDARAGQKVDERLTPEQIARAARQGL